MNEDANIRRENLRRLGLGPAELVKLIGKTPSYWSSLLNSPKKSFGERAARDIEEKLNRPRGWLDQPHSGRGPDRTPQPVEAPRAAQPAIDDAIPVVLHALASLPALQLGKACAEIERLADHPDAVGEACSRISDLLATAARRKRSAA